MSIRKKRVDISGDRLTLDGLGSAVAVAGAVLGTLGLLAAAGLAWSRADGWAAFHRSYLVSFCYFLGLGLGALFFVLLQHLTRAGWGVVTRRVAEGTAANLFLPLVVLALPLVLGAQYLFPWARAAEVAADPVLQHKAAYLNVPFFSARMAVYFGAWALLSRLFWRRSVSQDSTGDPAATIRMEHVATWGTYLFALTLTFFAFDCLMSLDPDWYSTIFGVYYFAGSFVSGLALVVVAFFLLQRAGRVRLAVTPEHFHDLGKLVFGFVVFWAYIAFSQYLLIWYANIPEETTWYLRRQQGPWTAVSLVLLFGHFFLPLVVLLSRYPKRRSGLLAAAAVWILAVHWFDVYWLVMPEFSPARLPLGWMDLACFVGIGGWFVAAAAFRLRAVPLIPIRDPRVEESLSFENV